MIEALSDISRTNQLQITQTPQEVAEKLYLYLFNIGKGIECFDANNLDFDKGEYSQLSFYQRRHRAIKHEIKKRLYDHGEDWAYSKIQYFISYSHGKNYVFFLTPNKKHSGWKKLFCNVRSNREKILNLIFKVHILSEGLPVPNTMNGFEELLLLHSMNLTKTESGLVVWGQSLFLNYNHHEVLTLTLSRKRLIFLPEDQYRTLDGEEMGELLIYKKRRYYCSNELDARSKNSIKFMRFDKEDESFEKFQKTQFYHYQNLMTKLENFLHICGIAYTPLNFQADHYLENRFIKNIEFVQTLEIINNSGTDFTETHKQFLDNYLKNQGVLALSFYNSGKTISTYKYIENEEKPCWNIREDFPWNKIELSQGENYLVFNRILDEESGISMAYQKDDLWYPATNIADKPVVDFYSQLKRKINYLETGAFFSIQGMNVMEFKIIGDKKDTLWSALNYSGHKIDKDILRQDTQAFTDGKFLGVEETFCSYLIGQNNAEELEKFCKKHKIKISPEFQKILIELGVKNWIRESLSNSEFALPVTPQSFSEKQFFAIYVRKPQKQEAKAVAVEFLYKEGNLYIKSVLRDVKEIQNRFPILRKRKIDPETLIDEQQYFVDEEDQIFISCYTDNFFTPMLIGRETILKDLENGTLELNRRKDNKLLPLVMYYNDDVQQVKNLICLDLHNEHFIQYYVPPAKNLSAQIKNGFRVYHLIGKTYSGKMIPTTELIKHPITSLHFNTLTQNILKISDNSQSSLLQKVAKIFIEN
jgi:hypothetical protein